MSARKGKVELVVKVPQEELRGSVLLTGFPGFGRIGYVVPRYIASALSLRKVGYIITPRVPSVVVMEDDGVGLPFEIYYGKAGDQKVMVLVNRAVPEPLDQHAYCSELASWTAEVGVSYAVLVGGLSRDYEPVNDTYKYRWLHNSHFTAPQLRAPKMEGGLGVIGPLALLHIYLEHRGVPAVMVLPYSVVDGIDYDAALVGANVILGELLRVQASVEELAELARRQREALERMAEALYQDRSRESSSSAHIFM